MLLSYILILVLSLTIGSVSYLQALRIIKKEVKQYNIAMLQQAQHIVDERLIAIDQLALNIALATKIKDFLYVKHPMAAADIYNMSKVITEMSKYKNISDFAEEIYVYFRNSDIIISSSAKYEPLLFYQEIVPYDQWDYDQWKSLLVQGHYKEYTPLQSLNLSTGKKDIITYFQSLPYEDKKNPMATLAISIRADNIESLLSRINVLNRGIIYIIDSNNQIIMSVGDKRMLAPIQYEDLSPEKDYIYSHINSEKVVITYVSSSINDWKYVSIVPDAVFMNDVRYIKNLIAAVIALELLIGLMLAFYLARNNYIPIKRLVDKLKEKITPDNVLSDTRNEIEFIDNITAATIKQNQSITQAMQRQQSIMKSNMMMQLIKGSIDDINELPVLFEFMDVSFPNSFFSVSLISIDNFNEFINDDSFQKRVLIKSVIADEAEKLGNINSKAYLVDMDWDQMALLVNVEGCESKDTAEIQAIAYQLQQFMAKEYAIFISIGIGSIKEGLTGISVSYKEAVNALNYRMVKGQNAIIASGDITVTEQLYDYPVEDEMKLINAVKSGNTDKVKKLMEGIFEKNFNQRDLSLDLSRCLFFDIMSTAIKILNDLDALNVVFGQNYEPLKHLMSCHTIDEMYHTLEIIYERICDYVHENKKSHNNELKNRILDYLEEHYTDNLLSLTVVADTIGINSAYLSFFFREQVGENFVDYICKLRISKIKELLKDFSLTLDEIAKRVGYSSSGVLIRTFKRYEGITPGQYRDTLETLF
jgi:AraC-like DNA-binding protein